MTSDPQTSSLPIRFDELGLHADLLRAITDCGYTQATPIQAQAIPHVLAGRDVMGAAQTGTGKTAAFTLPILQRLMPHASASASPARHPVRALILSPTRELADQISQNVADYCRHVPLRSTVVYGGVDIHQQIQALRSGVEVLVATPGRLLDHVTQKTVALGQVQILVLDEADRMLDMGFLPDLQRILDLLPEPRQSLLFSATFSPEIRKLAQRYLKDPVYVEVAARNAAAETVTQAVYQFSREDDKRAAVGALFRQDNLGQAIVFTNTKLGAARLARWLAQEGFRTEAIHGDKSQLERNKALDQFKAGELDLLVATDVAARGLDIAELPAVFNFDLPYSPEDYVHRIGRTGRAGASGRAYSLMTANDDKLLVEIEKLIKRPIPRGQIQLPERRQPERFEERPRSSDGASSRSERDGFRRGAPTDDSRRRPPRRDDDSARDHQRGRRYDLPPPLPRLRDDEFFYRPYVEKLAPAEAGDEAAAGLASNSRRPSRPVAALLGGGRKAKLGA